MNQKTQNKLEEEVIVVTKLTQEDIKTLITLHAKSKRINGITETLVIIKNGKDSSYVSIKQNGESYVNISGNFISTGKYNMSKEEIITIIENKAEQDFGRKWNGLRKNYSIKEIN